MIKFGCQEILCWHGWSSKRATDPVASEGIAMSTGDDMAGATQLNWQKSSKCDSATCVEVASTGDQIVVRDSKEIDGPVLRFSAAQWSSFVAGVRAGDFGLS